MFLESREESGNTSFFSASREETQQPLVGRVPITDGYLISVDGREFVYRAPPKATTVPTTPGKNAPTTPGKKAAVNKSPARTPKRPTENENPNVQPVSS